MRLATTNHPANPSVVEEAASVDAGITHMSLKPIDRMLERVRVAREDTDTTLFYDLMFLGEMVTKLVTAGLIATVQDDSRNQYALLHRIIRADGLGEWTQALDEVLIGVASQHLLTQAREVQRELTQKSGQGTWQFEAARLITECLKQVDPDAEGMQAKVDGRLWFSTFTRLRNKTRGHGATLPTTCGALCAPLEQSIRLIIGHCSILRCEWAFLHRNLSGKYRVTALGGSCEYLNKYKSTEGSANLRLPDGVYIHLGDQGDPLRVELLHTDADAVDFYLANGGFDGKQFEMISYITDSKIQRDGSAYLSPPLDLPISETQGVGHLDLIGDCFANLPPHPSNYIHRSELEREITRVLQDEHRYPIVTLVGRGGIGKTSLAISVLHTIAKSTRFGAILWFSARDIDLREEGPKPVRPHVLTQKDIAREYVALVGPTDSHQRGFDALSYLASSLSSTPLGFPILFVFDNFETVRNPVDLYNWIDTFVRPPNKVLITSKAREFKGDYWVDVSGMTPQECDDLIDATCEALHIGHLIDDTYRQNLIQESDGHPYVIKILLGEVAKAGKPSKIDRIVASQDDVLQALFERTFVALTPVGQRVFFTLCNWRSTVPQLAVEAVLLRTQNEHMNVQGAIDELHRSSFIEMRRSAEDDEVFISVPLVAAIFGARKLAVSPMKSAVEADTTLLRYFGAMQQTSINRGIAPRIERLFRQIAERIGRGTESLDDHLPMLEFLGRKYPPAWLLLARLYQETGGAQGIEKAKDAVLHYLESPTDESMCEEAWRALALLCHSTDDFTGEIHALVEMCQLPGATFVAVSEAANRVNGILYALSQGGSQYVLDTDEKQILVRKLIRVMEDRIDEADADDCSRLAWLHLQVRNDGRAKELAEIGLVIDPNNIHCKRLANKFALAEYRADHSH